MPPDGVTDMVPLFCPQDVGVADPFSVIPDEALSVMVAVAVQAGEPLSDIVTVYVPDGTFVGFWPVKPPVQL